MYSVGDLVDKLIIENIKIAMMKEKLNSVAKKSDALYVEMYQKMMDLNINRSIIAKELDAKLDRVLHGEKNSILKSIKTYG